MLTGWPLALFTIPKEDLTLEDESLSDAQDPAVSLVLPPPEWVVALRMEDGLICGYYDLSLGQPELAEGVELYPLTEEEHDGAFLSYATHFELEPELRAVRLEVPEAADTHTVEEKLAAIGLSIEELRNSLLSEQYRKDQPVPTMEV